MRLWVGMLSAPEKYYQGLGSIAFRGLGFRQITPNSEESNVKGDGNWGHMGAYRDYVFRVRRIEG